MMLRCFSWNVIKIKQNSKYFPLPRTPNGFLPSPSFNPKIGSQPTFSSQPSAAVCCTATIVNQICTIIACSNIVWTYSVRATLAHNNNCFTRGLPSGLESCTVTGKSQQQQLRANQNMTAIQTGPVPTLFNSNSIKVNSLRITQRTTSSFTLPVVNVPHISRLNSW